VRTEALSLDEFPSEPEAGSDKWSLDFEEREKSFTLTVRIEGPPKIITAEYWEPLKAVKPYNIDIWGPELIKLRIIRSTADEIAQVVRALSDRGIEIPERLRYLGGIA
jgi:hypothetical protein